MVHNEPDIASYTRLLSSPVDGHGSPDAVTSATCTVAADCVATHRSRFGYGYPVGMVRALEQSARHPAQSPVSSSDLGYGIMSPVAALSKLRTVS